MHYITSLQNPDIKKIVTLHDKKGRLQHKLFIVEGIRSVKAFLDAQWKPEQLFLTQAAYDGFSELTSNQNRVTLVSPEVMSKISTATTPSGILALFKIPEPVTLPVIKAGLVLAGISDAGNMGTLIRTAAAVGSTTIIIIEGCDPWSPKVVQASAGALALVSIFHMPWAELIRLKGNIALCALVVTEGKLPEEIDLCNALLVVGSEAHGIPAEWINECELRMTLPMLGKTESLNAAIAGSIALYLQSRAVAQHSKP